MKITVKKSVDQEIELPKYFKSGHERFYMILDEDTLLHVKNYTAEDASLGLYPFIDRSKISYVAPVFAIYGFQEITEEEFRKEFVEVSLHLESLMN
jgi:hypothetical protein